MCRWPSTCSHDSSTILPLGVQVEHADVGLGSGAGWWCIRA